MAAAERVACLRGLEKADAAATAAGPRCWPRSAPGRATSTTGITARSPACCTGPRSPAAWRRTHRLGQAQRGTPRGPRGAGRGGDLGVLCPGDLPVDRPPPGDARAAADEILLAAAAAGPGTGGPGGLAAEMYEKSRQDQHGERRRGDTGFDDRAVSCHHDRRGGVIHGDLTPECAEFVQMVLDALAAPAGADDDRSMSSGTTTRCRKPCGGCWPRGCCPNGAAAGPGLGPHLPGRPDADRGHLRAAGGMDRGTCGPGGPGTAPPPPKPADIRACGWPGTPPRRSRATPPSPRW